MKSRIVIALSFIALLAAPFAYGQAGQPGQALASLNIPFKFMVGKKELPAGKYEVWTTKADAAGENSSLLLRNYQAKTSIFVTVIERLAETEPNVKHGAKVVFDNVNDMHYLSEFWPANNADGYLLGITKGEQKHEIVEAK